MVPEMGITLFISVVAITFLFIYMLRLTLRVERLDAHIKIQKYKESF